MRPFGSLSTVMRPPSGTGTCAVCGRRAAEHDAVVGHAVGLRGDKAGQHPELTSLAPDGFGALDFDETWLGSVAFLAEAAYALGEAEHAKALYERLRPYADRVAVCTPEVGLASVPRYLGPLAAASGRPALAAEHFEAAVDRDTRLGARAFAALTLADHAALTDDPALAARAVDACTAVGMHSVAERAAAVLG